MSKAPREWKSRKVRKSGVGSSKGELPDRSRQFCLAECAWEFVRNR